MHTLCIHTTAGSTYAYNIIILQYSIRIRSYYEHCELILSSSTIRVVYLSVIDD